VEFVVLCKHVEFAVELCVFVLPLEELIVFIHNVMLSELGSGVGFLLGAGFFQIHDDIDVAEESLGLGNGMFGLEGFEHHEGDAVVVVILAEDAVVLLAVPRLLHK
jgi:hypothetical protein